MTLGGVGGGTGVGVVMDKDLETRQWKRAEGREGGGH